MSSPDQTPSFRISIVDANKNRFSRLTELLESQNLRVTFHVGSNTDANFISELREATPDIVVINLFLDGKSTLNRIKAIKADMPAAKIIVLTAHNSINNIRESVKAGADDFILDPFEPQLMLDRLRYQLQEREMFNPEALNEASPPSESMDAPNLAASQKNVDLIYESLRSLSEITDHHEALTTVLEAVATNADSKRVNLIEGDLETNRGLVAASSDDNTLMDLEIDLERYPEVREVLLNGNIIYIKDITQNPLTKDIQDQVKSIKITSLLVFPIRHRSNTLGSLNIRLSGDGSVSERQLKTYFIIALALGPKLAAKKLLRKHKLAKDFASIASAPKQSGPETTEEPTSLPDDTIIPARENDEDFFGSVEEQLEKESEKSDGEMSLEDALREAEAQINSGESVIADSDRKEPEISASSSNSAPSENETEDDKEVTKEVTIDDLLQSVEDENS
ncbi:response regulator [bacterium]|nr:response regulator [bacterium]